jgi:ABC-type polysaccharide/polyol phosphate transport system ATPase subunit
VSATSAATAVTVDHVSKSFRMYAERNQSIKSAIMRGRTSVHEDFWALKDVSFEVPVGSTFGLIGSNGSGKSTLLKCLAKIYYPNKGTISYNGRIAAMLEVGSGFHVEMSGRENIYLNGSILGMTKKEVTRKLDEIVDFSGVEAFIDQPVKNYSSGMYVRLGFAIAINVDPDVLVVDEVLAVGDAEFREKCLQKFRDFKQAGKTVILVSHDMDTVIEMCDETAWLRQGELVAVGKARPTIASYLESLPGDIGE